MSECELPNDHLGRLTSVTLILIIKNKLGNVQVPKFGRFLVKIDSPFLVKIFLLFLVKYFLVKISLAFGQDCTMEIFPIHLKMQ